MRRRRGGRTIPNADRIALVTGTSSGIGAAVAGRLLQNGWQVAGVARRPATIRHPQYTHLRIDLSEIDETTSVVANTIVPMLAAPWKRVGLVNNAALGGQLGPTERIDARALAQMFAVNVSAPIHLMGMFVKCIPAAAALRIVNVSSGAGVRAFPGLTAYGASKAALRMAGMVLASELDARPRDTQEIDAAILSYEPGTVDTEMQTEARNTPVDRFPWVQTFKDFKANKQLVTPDKPAAEIAAWLESDGQPRFSERRLGRS
jgi:NAD(P)-dependent dehydrogenase (short-subunit alcohol dehydrogenase family)